MSLAHENKHTKLHIHTNTLVAHSIDTIVEADSVYIQNPD